MKSILVVFISLILFSCSGEKKADIPKDVLTEEKMAKVMTDIHLLEASMNMNISNTVALGNVSDIEATTLELFKKDSVTKEQYETSFIFYSNHPEVFMEVYKLVLNNLSQLQAEVANEKDTTAVKKVQEP